MGREDNKSQFGQEPAFQPGSSKGSPLKRRGLCLQAHPHHHPPCQDCEECIWVDQVPLDKDYGDIVFIHAASSHPDSDTVEVKLDIQARRGLWRKYQCWNKSSSDEPALEEQVINMQHPDLEGFINGLKDAGLLHWGERYEADEGKGGEWVVRIEFEGFRIKKSGSNSYPRRWNSLCQLFKEYWQVEFR